MPIRFQADADLNQIIVSAVVRRVPGIDFRTAMAAGWLASATKKSLRAPRAMDASS